MNKKSMSNGLIQEFSEYIERLKLKGKNIAYYPSLEMDHDTSTKVELHFQSLGYITNFRRCAQCNSKYDVILEWVA
jgi:recombinational DNA repair protein (RecF pathway)